MRIDDQVDEGDIDDLNQAVEDKEPEKKEQAQSRFNKSLDEEFFADSGVKLEPFSMKDEMRNGIINRDGAY